MQTRLGSRVLGTALVAVAVSFGVSAQQGVTPPPANDAPLLRLRIGTFTPARGERPVMRDALTLRELQPGRRGYHIVQFDGPIEGAWKNAVSAAGAEILEYIPDFAVKVRMTPGQAIHVGRLPRVLWMGAFHPAYKLPPDGLRSADDRPYTVRVESGANAIAVEAEIVATGARVAQRDGAVLTIVANGNQLDAVARVLEVASIEPFALRHKHNEFGGGIIGAEFARAAGYDGSTQTIAVADTGIGGGTAATAHADLAPGRVAAVFNWPGVPNACFESVAHDGPIDVDTGHGTHVAMSALGGGNASGGGRGTAPASRLVFQAIEDYVIPSFVCQILLGLPPGYYLAGIPADVGALFAQSYSAGARVHSNSWGSASAGAYTEDSASTDAFVWAHRDLVVTMSAGNNGVDANRDGIVDPGSINAPGTAKNVITIGASEGDRGSDYACDPSVGGSCTGQNHVFTYAEAFGASFAVNPLRDDPTAGNAQQMAAFSSRGPTADGRIKPDVVAPGTWILSGYADNFQPYYDSTPNPQNGAFQYDGWGEPLDDKYKYMGGTSMSAPLVAGAAAVVRDYFEKAYGHSATAALVKATLVNTAIDLLDENNDGLDDNAFPIPNIHEGWGRVDLAAATDGSRQFVDESIALTTGDTSSHTVTVDTSLRPLRVTLAWTDAPGSTTAARALVNDLDLQLIAPDGLVYSGNVFVDGWSSPAGAADRINNLENVYVPAPAAGEWTVVVRGFNVPQGPQPYALVIGREATPVQIVSRVSVTALTTSIAEAGSTPATLSFTRTGNIDQELSVSYAVSGTASPGADYTALPGTVMFQPGSAEALVTVTPIDDPEVEGNETVTVAVFEAPGYGVRAPASATVTIVSDDQPGDLVISAVTAPSPVATGASIVVTDSTRNQATWPVQPSRTGFYLSTNTTFDAADVFIGEREVPALGPGSVDTRSTTVTLPPHLTGIQYVIAKADWDDRLVEARENNNTRNSSAVRIGPDLTIVSVTAPAYGAAGGSIAVADTTRNDGVSASPSSKTAYYLSANTTLDAADHRLGSRVVGPLSPGTTEQGTISVLLPADAAVGSYYVIARADDEGVVGEANETNNTRYVAGLKVGPDLIIAAITVPATAGSGTTISVTDTTRNEGAANAGESTTAFYLSTNSTFGGGDIRLGSRTINGIGAGQSTTSAVNLALPTTVAAGAYWLIAIADDGNAVVESVETNNSRTAATQLRVGPDLTVSGVSVPAMAAAGAAFAITDTIKNVGGAASMATEAVVYLSTNTTLDAADIEVGRRGVPVLDAGAVHTATFNVAIPADLEVGSYYLFEQVDVANVVLEPVETNNTYRTAAIRIGPDFTVSALSGPATVTNGSSFNVTDATKNAGAGPAPPSVTAFYLSLNSTLEPGDVAVGARAVPALAAGASHTATSVMTIPAGTAAGTYYLIANANDGAHAETQTSNNTRRVVIKISP